VFSAFVFAGQLSALTLRDEPLVNEVSLALAGVVMGPDALVPEPARSEFTVFFTTEGADADDDGVGLVVVVVVGVVVGAQVAWLTRAFCVVVSAASFALAWSTAVWVDLSLLFSVVLALAIAVSVAVWSSAN
jgi:hypothetical protein